MGLGTPVVCSDYRENRYVVDDCALTFARGDINDLRETLRRALDAPRDLRTLGARGRERVARLFSWDAAAQPPEAAFSDLQARPTRPAARTGQGAPPSLYNSDLPGRLHPLLLLASSSLPL